MTIAPGLDKLQDHSFQSDFMLRGGGFTCGAEGDKYTYDNYFNATKKLTANDSTNRFKTQKMDKNYPMGTRVDGVYDNTNYCINTNAVGKLDMNTSYITDGEITWQDYATWHNTLQTHLQVETLTKNKYARELDPVMARNMDQLHILGGYIKSIGKWDDFLAGKYVVNVDPSENIMALAPMGEGMMDMYYIPDEIKANYIPAAALPYYNKMMQEMEAAEMPVGDITNPDKNNDGVSDDPKKAAESMDKAMSYDEREFLEDVQERGELNEEIREWSDEYRSNEVEGTATDYTTYIIMGVVILGGFYFLMNSKTSAPAPPPPVPQ